MKNFIIITSCILIFIVANVFSQPKIYLVGGDTHDWGKVNFKNKTLTAKIKVLNYGTKTLMIHDVSPDCNCTTAYIDKNSIEPNGFATISITLNFDWVGIISKSVFIRSNDSNSPEKILYLKGNIITPVELSNQYMLFSNMDFGKQSTYKITLTNNTAKDIKFKNIVVEPKEVKINLKKNTVLSAGKSLILTGKYTPYLYQNLKGSITISTDNKDMEKVIITVLGNVNQVINNQYYR